MRVLLTLLSLALLTAALNCRSVLASDVIYTSTSNGRLQRYDTSAALLGSFPIPLAVSIAVDREHRVYVSPIGSSIAIQYDSAGGFLNALTPTPFPDDPASVNALGLALDLQDRLYLGVNSSHDRIERFNSDGQSLGVFTSVGISGHPWRFEFDVAGNLYVMDGSNVEHFNANGAYLGRFATVTGHGMDIAFDAHGNLYTTSFGITSIIQKFDSSGNPLGTIVTANYLINALALDSNDVLYAAGIGRIDRFHTDGTPLGTFLTAPQGTFEFTDIFIVRVPEPVGSTLFVVGLVALMSSRRWSRKFVVVGDRCSCD